MLFHVHHYHHLDIEAREEVMRRLDRIDHGIGLLLNRTDTIMAAIDDLKTSIAALIAEATSDITQLINRAASGSSDPAMAQLATDVNAATKSLHDQFEAATGTPIPTP